MKSVSTEILQQEGFIQSPRELNGQVGKRFHFIGKLGEGAFGIVFAVVDKLSGKRVALKKIKMSKKCQGIPSFALRQIGILKYLNSPYIIKIQEVFYDFELPQLCFVLQYHSQNLHELIKQKNPLNFKKIKDFTYQILKTLEYLHGKGIIHRDLKPQNFLITESQTLCLCDFGQAKYTDFKAQQHSVDISTLWYRAPQILLGCQIYDQKIDVWAAGCIIAEMMLGKPLFATTSQIALIFSIFRLLGTPKIQEFPNLVKMKDFSVSYPKFLGEGINIEGCCSQSLDLLRKMLVINPEERIGVDQALRHQFLMGVEDRCVSQRENKEK